MPPDECSAREVHPHVVALQAAVQVATVAVLLKEREAPCRRFNSSHRHQLNRHIARQAIPAKGRLPLVFVDPVSEHSAQPRADYERQNGPGERPLRWRVQRPPQQGHGGHAQSAAEQEAE
jgi:hypothetical protein